MVVVVLFCFVNMGRCLYYDKATAVTAPRVLSKSFVFNLANECTI